MEKTVEGSPTQVDDKGHVNFYTFVVHCFRVKQLFIVLGFLGSGASEQISTGLCNGYHATILFSTMRRRPFLEEQVAWLLDALYLGWI